jgi:ABC-type spermidine/putrescine transport system permease subunit I
MIGLGVWQRRLLIGLPFFWLAVFFLLPLALVAGISLAESADAIPPFALRPTLANYREIAEGCLRVYAASVGHCRPARTGPGFPSQ